MNNFLVNKKILSVCYSVFWDRFNLYGFQSILVLYVITAFSFSDKISYSLYGSYIALSYAFAVIGGVIADRLLGFFYATVVGGVLIIFANIIFCFGNDSVFKVALAIMVVGIGFLKPNNTNLLGMIHQEDSLERNRAFSFFYTAISLGGIVGPVIFGLTSINHAYRYAFALNAVGMATSLLALRQVKSFSRPQSSNFFLLKIFSIIVTSVVLSWIFISYNAVFGYFIGFGIILAGLWSIKIIKTLSIVERGHILSLLSPILGGVIYLAALLQIYSTITLFIERFVDRHIFGWTIPASWFSTLEPVCIFFMIPVLDWVWGRLSHRGNISAQYKIVLGLFAACLAFLIFTMVTQMGAGDTYIIILALLLGNLLLAIGELCIIPVTMSLISLVGPLKYRSTLMGMFYFSFTFSGYLSGLVGKFQQDKSIITADNYTFLFMGIALILLVTAMVIGVLNKFLKVETQKPLAQNV